MSAIILLIAAVIYFQISWLILNNINDSVPKPYMDEIFHIPQAQQYCLGNYNEVCKYILSIDHEKIGKFSVINLIFV